MAAGSYTPAVPGVQVIAGTQKLAALGAIAKQFVKYYPGICINFLGESYYANESVTTRAAAGSLPDIWTQQFDAVNDNLPPGVATNLWPYFQKSDPYIPANTKWVDAMNPEVVTESEQKPGVDYDVNGDYVGVEFFYNKSLFRQAGISAVPQTWSQLISDELQLKLHGITAGATDVESGGGYDWMNQYALGNFLGLDTLKQIQADSGGNGISLKGQAIAYRAGILNPTKNPRILGWWPLAKTMFSNFDTAVTELPATPPAGAATDQTVFAAGKVAMILEGTETPNAALLNGAKFPIGSFAMPTLQGASPYSTAYDSGNDAGGPEAAYQWFLSTPKSDSGLKSTGEQQAAIDWLRFLATPTRDQAVVNELGDYLPTFEGTEPVPALRGAEAQVSEPLYQVDGGQAFTTEFTVDVRGIFEEYLLGNTSLTDATKQYDSGVQAAYEAYVRLHPLPATS